MRADVVPAPIPRSHCNAVNHRRNTLGKRFEFAWRDLPLLQRFELEIRVVFQWNSLPLNCDTTTHPCYANRLSHSRARSGSRIGTVARMSTLVDSALHGFPHPYRPRTQRNCPSAMSASTGEYRSRQADCLRILTRDDLKLSASRFLDDWRPGHHLARRGFVNLLAYCGVGQQMGKGLHSAIYQTKNYRARDHVVKIQVRRTPAVRPRVEVVSQQS